MLACPAVRAEVRSLIRMRAILLTFLCAGLLSRLGAATFYVALTGDDANPGTTRETAWRTVQRAANTLRAGDTVLVGSGDYAEYVATTQPGASEDVPIVFRGDPDNDPAAPAVLRSFRVRHPFIVVEGFTFRYASDAHLPWNSSWSSVVRIEPEALGTIVRNNLFGDAARVIAEDFQFDSLSNGLTSASSDFRAAGFVPGAHIYIGSCGQAPYWPTNHNTRWMVRDLSADGHTLYVTNGAGESFQPDPGTYWGLVHAGNGPDGHYGILFVRTGGLAADRCQILGNTFSNLVGHAMNLFGTRTLVQSNRIFNLHSYRPFQVQGSDLIIRDNLIKDCRNVLWYLPSEVKALTHPLGAEWLDYQIGMVSAFAAGSTNNLIEHNWFQNLENQLGFVSSFEDSYGIYFRSNVFVGVSEHFSGGRRDMQWVNNTFYRCAFDLEESFPLAIGGRPPAHTGYVISSNVFVDCGDHRGRASEGWYAISTNAVDAVLDWNYVAGAEITGWEAKRTFNEPNGVNGGDPLFVNAQDPLGPDGLPFTADDGLRPLPTSPIAERGLGALSPVSTHHPVAHFTVVSPTGWFDRVDSSFDPQWTTNAPFRRQRKMRPYTTPDALGAVPVTVVFSAAGSFPGFDERGVHRITSYGWNFGEGSAAVSFSPTATYTFTNAGTITVSLSVTTADGTSDRVSRQYRLLSAPNPEVPESRPTKASPARPKR